MVLPTHPCLCAPACAQNLCPRQLAQSAGAIDCSAMGVSLLGAMKEVRVVYCLNKVLGSPAPKTQSIGSEISASAAEQATAATCELNPGRRISFQNLGTNITQML